jgi:hypothetical protein
MQKRGEKRLFPLVAVEKELMKSAIYGREASLERE